MAKPLTRSEIEALAADLKSMLARIEAGELEATTTMRHRIEGALIVLEVVQGHAPSLLLDRLR